MINQFLVILKRLWLNLLKRKKRILILSANPEDTSRLRLDKEVRKIEDGLNSGSHRDQYHIQSKWAVRYKDLRRALLKYSPYIVHFSGHGKEEGLMVEGELGLAVPISSRALFRLFKLCSPYVRCVILNACYSALQADIIRKHINYVIGIPEKINDKAAVEFSEGFYDALGNGKSVEDAFEFGCNAVEQIAPDLSEYLMPVLRKKEDAEFVVHGSNDEAKSKKIVPTFLVLVVIAAILLFYLLFLKPDNKSGPIEKVEKEGKTLIEKKVNERVKNGEIVLVEKKANLLTELREKGLLEKLKEASAYCDARSPDGEDKALTLYREVIDKLSPRVWQAFKLLKEAENDFNNNYFDDAREKYKALFDKIINN